MTTPKQRTAFSTLIAATAVLAFVQPAMLHAETTHEMYTSTDHRLICTELGLTPDAMAALGVQGFQVSGLFVELDDSSGLIASLRTIQTQHQNALQSLKAAQRSIRHAEDAAEETLIQGEIEQLTSQIASLNQSIEQSQAQIRLTVLPSGISSDDIARVCEPAGLAALVPVEFRFVALQDSDYTDLINALAAEQRALNEGVPLDTSTQLLLSSYRNLPAVTQARSNLLYNLDAVRGAFND